MKQPLTEKDFYRPKRKSPPRLGRWSEKIAAWLKTDAAKKFKAELNEIKH